MKTISHLHSINNFSLLCTGLSSLDSDLFLTLFTQLNLLNLIYLTLFT